MSFSTTTSYSGGVTATNSSSSTSTTTTTSQQQQPTHKNHHFNTSGFTTSIPSHQNNKIPSSTLPSTPPHHLRNFLLCYLLFNVFLKYYYIYPHHEYNMNILVLQCTFIFQKYLRNYYHNSIEDVIQQNKSTMILSNGHGGGGGGSIMSSTTSTFQKSNNSSINNNTNNTSLSSSNSSNSHNNSNNNNHNTNNITNTTSLPPSSPHHSPHSIGNSSTLSNQSLIYKCIAILHFLMTLISIYYSIFYILFQYGIFHFILYFLPNIIYYTIYLKIHRSNSSSNDSKQINTKMNSKMFLLIFINMVLLPSIETTYYIWIYPLLFLPPISEHQITSTLHIGNIINTQYILFLILHCVNMLVLHCWIYLDIHIHYIYSHMKLIGCWKKEHRSKDKLLSSASNSSGNSSNSSGGSSASSSGSNSGSNSGNSASGHHPMNGTSTTSIETWRTEKSYSCNQLVHFNNSIFRSLGKKFNRNRPDNTYDLILYIVFYPFKYLFYNINIYSYVLLILLGLSTLMLISIFAYYSLFSYSNQYLIYFVLLLWNYYLLSKSIDKTVQCNKHLIIRND
ncbi:hypothetical protein C9374_005454 [Naegleria lovaniensis]|uniref:Uncharacterized protein n=1 Tax=Naegleria lovaniensis TaxID=51637 RepID=A0AA88GPZ3_NAELO|nr:uncharacterized protein C9374_005454 [Naegleria lovaniensis]KAG2382252.1 hypothetical protein C9374_005454 [Naegleria lovaniensis]